MINFIIKEKIIKNPSLLIAYCEELILAKNILENQKLLAKYIALGMFSYETFTKNLTLANAHSLQKDFLGKIEIKLIQELIRIKYPHVRELLLDIQNTPYIDIKERYKLITQLTHQENSELSIE